MTPPTKTVRVSAEARDQLIRLKRFTRIDQWNILCRWALCRSLAETTRPSALHSKEMSNIEMSWPVFAGALSEVLLLLLRQRCVEDGIDPKDDKAVAEELSRHLHRGIATLASGGEALRSIEDLLALTNEVGDEVGGARARR